MDYEVTSPDGRKFRITAPDGATQEQVLAYAKANFPKPEPEAKLPERNQMLETGLKLGRGFLQGGPLGLAAAGVGGAVENIDKAADVAGGATTDVLAKVVPAEVAAGAGTAVKMLPAAVGGLVGGGSFAPAMKAGAEKLMHSALKPSSKDILSGDAAKAIDTLLKEDVNISVAGATKLRGMINKISAEVAQKIASAQVRTPTSAGWLLSPSQPATIDKAHVASELYGTLQKFRNQVNPGADSKAILSSWEEFKNMVANKIPVQEAQALKQGTYKVLADKYARAGAVENEAATQAQMSMARGLRKGIEGAVPGIGGLNAREAALINALEMAERRAGIGGNKDIGGIALLANNPAAAAAMMADRSAAFKSWLANKIYSLRHTGPGAVGAGTAAGYQASQQ